MALVAEFGRRGRTVVGAAEIQRRSEQVRKALTEGRTRGKRKTRYRKPSFLSRTQTCDGCGRHGRRAGIVALAERWMGKGSVRDKGLSPSLASQVESVVTWATRLCRYGPVFLRTVEQVKFDTQLLQNPDISGVEYRPGCLVGYELPEYPLARFSQECVYCGGASGDPLLNIDHVISRSRDGIDPGSNPGIACRSCSEANRNRMPAERMKELIVSSGEPDCVGARRFPEAFRRSKTAAAGRGSGEYGSVSDRGAAEETWFAFGGGDREARQSAVEPKRAIRG